ncbi:hypothetical protein ASD65_17440 [Microbacterium sp. Root61]|uniref:hypothetical protein n=1 Tax=Microbacterium sp. Root61 TaxID=1736570 RepID=UPI0007022477|nr:hypothetical protein [Microbacterium sp. Root61]KRA22277.1 hypothetical protein ASD65_17440 [Microbacterium sp. Root61]
MGASDVLEYRLPTGRIVVVTAVAVFVATVVLTLLVPSRDFPTMIPLALFGGWVAWVFWTLPCIELSRSTVVVRNSLHTVTIPLAAIVQVTGGKRLTIRTADRRTYIPAAAAGPGSFLWGAVRRTEAFGGYIVPVTRVDALRLDMERERTPASIIARMIQKRIDELPEEERRTARNPDGTVREIAPPVLNMTVIVGSIVVSVVSVSLFFVLL